MKKELFLNYMDLPSERLLLRKITRQDIPDLFEIYSNREVMLYFPSCAIMGMPYFSLSSSTTLFPRRSRRPVTPSTSGFSGSLLVIHAVLK